MKNSILRVGYEINFNGFGPIGNVVKKTLEKNKKIRDKNLKEFQDNQKKSKFFILHLGLQIFSKENTLSAK